MMPMAVIAILWSCSRELFHPRAIAHWLKSSTLLAQFREFTFSVGRIVFPALGGITK
jgi:hypothetical protein